MAIKAHLQRIILIARKIQSRPYITLEELGEALEHEMAARGLNTATSPNTLKRDIQELRESFYIDVKYNRSQGGYHIERGEQADIESLLEPFDMLYTLNADGGLPEFMYPETHRPKGTKHLFTLMKAIRQHKHITFTYSKYATLDSSQREIAAYALKESRGRWYVIGKEIAGTVKTFGLDRIENLKIMGSRFSPDPKFNIEHKFKDSFGIYSDEAYPIEEVVLSFDAEDGGYLKSVPLHSSQEIVKDTTEEFVIKLRLRLTLDFIMEIVSRSWSLRVIAPNSLRQQVCDIYKASLERNAL
ncbi:MAG: helix-turn-helix transcriptional regulator [Bacteroidales bacterium]